MTDNQEHTPSLSISAIVLAHQFILKSRKSRERDEKALRMQRPGADRALNMRQAILEKEQQIDHKMNVMAGQKSKNWDMLKKKLATAKITDALTALKFEVNGKMYTALKPLGEGGYSQVFEVYNTSKELFALKVVNLGQQNDKMRNDLIGEILFLEKLKNCNYVVKAFEYQIINTEDEDKMYVLMEKGGPDLHELIAKHKKKKNLTPARLRIYWEQMLTAVQEVHMANIIHADIKPGNFLYVKGELKLIDFGMATEIPPGQDHATKNHVCGTTGYMSPEVLAGALYNEEDDPKAETSIKITTKVDVWALGIFLYQIVYDGLLPFSMVPGGKFSKMMAISGKHPVDFADKDMDPHLLDTMKSCLEKDPAKRATVEQLLAHPFLRPQWGEVAPPVICLNCKSSQKAMAKVTQRRDRKNAAHSLNL